MTFLNFSQLFLRYFFHLSWVLLHNWQRESWTAGHPSHPGWPGTPRPLPGPRQRGAQQQRPWAWRDGLLLLPCCLCLLLSAPRLLICFANSDSLTHFRFNFSCSFFYFCTTCLPFWSDVWIYLTPILTFPSWLFAFYTCSKNPLLFISCSFMYKLLPAYLWLYCFLILFWY